MVGCTSFSCWDSESSDSALITGRNFDFYAGRKFARNKIVCFFNPSQGYKFMMISWATMSGAVSGMNEKGLTVTINAAKSSVPFQAATPVSLVAREILQYAENISEAYEIAKRRKMFVSETFLISSAADGKSVIIEKSPEKCGIVIPVSDYIICSNHYQGETFSDDKTNLENIRSSDSKFRYNRVDELVNKLAPLEVSEAASILRDRFAPGNKDPGPGNPMAINQLIAHHSVIFKPEELIVWVSEPPYQLGRYIAYDLKKVFSLNAGQIAENMEISSPELTIPADTFLYSESYRKYEQFLNLSEDLKEIKNSGRSLPDSFEIRYISSNPGFYLTYSKLGEYYYATGNYRKAYEYFDSALTRQIPGENVRDNLLEMKKNSIINSDNAGKRN
jgi:hypothetical protein